MTKINSFVLASLLVAFLAFTNAASYAQTSYPMLMSLKPVAAQAGQTSEHTIHSRYNMLGADKVFITGTGVAGEIIPPEIKEEDKAKPQNVQGIKVRFTVAPDALPGVRDFRISTPRGASTLGQLVIVRDPVILEADSNDNSEQAQQVSLPATLCGAIEKAEDVDFFKFSVEAGQSLNFHVRSMRLQNRIHDLQQHSDPIVTLRNAAGVTIASSDNFFFADPFFDFTFAQTGEYLLEIRDVRYQGNQYWEYSVEISDRPFVSNVYPLGVAPGQPTNLEMIGFRIPEPGRTELAVPATELGPTFLPLQFAGQTSNPVPLVISDLPLIQETDQDNNQPATAQLVSLPAGINGRIESESDIDCYVFEGKKDERYSFEVIARRQQSSLDSQLRILNEQGNQLQLNDDLRLGKRNHADSWIENWTVPADGKYLIEIRDVLLRGDKSFVYFIRATRSEPYFELYSDTDKTLLTPGNSGAIFVRVERKNGFDGEVQLEIDGLPAGVTAHCGRILAGKGQDGCIVLTAADAQITASNVTIRGTATIPNADGTTKNISTVASYYQEIYQPGGGRGHWPADMHTISVGEPNDIRKITLSTQEITLKPGESQKIDISIERADSFDQNITLDLMYQHLGSIYGNTLPEGVTIDAGQSKTLLTGKETVGHITVKAAEAAPPVDKQQIVVMANVSINFVMKTTYASSPVLVSVVAKE